MAVMSISTSKDGAAAAGNSAAPPSPSLIKTAETANNSQLFAVISGFGSLRTQDFRQNLGLAHCKFREKQRKTAKKGPGSARSGGHRRRRC
jgi:hypothetical protein